MQVPAFARGAFRGFQPDLISIIRALQPVGTIARGCLRRLLAAGMTAAPELAPSAANGHGDAALAAMALAKRRVAAAAAMPAEHDVADTFRAADLIVERRQELQVKPPWEGLKFGVNFSDHMLLVEHVAGQGWGAPRLVPFGPLAVHPAAQVLHYGMSCFEGMKAYKGPDGRPRLFRPDLNMARFRRSVARLGLADFDPQELLECLKELVRLEAAWVPNRPGHSLYLRPFACASGFSLGVPQGPCPRTTLSVVCSPVGPYWPAGLQPIRLFIDEEHVRAWPGGCGANKVAPNYGPTAPHWKAAQQHGASMVLYTLPHGSDPEAATVSEAGAMNVFFLIDQAGGGSRELVTPPLDGTILPGVHRASILELAREWGKCAVSERPLTLRELQQAAAEGRLREAFGCGTACLVQPVEALVRANRPPLAARPLEGEQAFAARIYKALSDIQYGRIDSPWSVPI